MKEFEATFSYEKSTRRTHRYEEDDTEGKAKVIGSLYVQQWALGTTPPQKIKVKVSVEA